MTPAQALGGRLSRQPLAPGDPGFEEATRLWNGLIDKTPALVVQPAGTADVVAALDYARAGDLAVSVRGGGHNIAGTALADGGLTLDMSGLRGIQRRPRTREPRPSSPAACSATSTARPSATAWRPRWASSPRSGWRA